MPSTILSDNGVSSGSAGLKTTAASDGSLALQTTTAGGSATTAVTIDTSQNVGVGVTPSAWNSDYKSVAVSNYAEFYGRVATPSVGVSYNVYRNSGGSFIYKTSNAAARYEQDSGYHLWYTAGSGTAGNAISFTQAMTLDASGNLGIGSTSPAALLHILSGSQEQIRLGRTTTGSSGYITFFANNSSSAQVQYAGILGDVVSSTAGSHGGALLFYTTGSGTSAERARIDSSGRWLVNTTSAALSASKAQISYSPSADYGLVMFPTNTSYNNASILFLNNGGTSVGYIYSTGSATTYSTTSDYRLKENIAPMTGALAKVAALKPCTYTWKADGSVSQGFIAHELQAVVPEAVVGEKDAVDEDGNPKYQGIDTSFLVATLTAAIQELNAKFEAYKATHP